MYTLIRQALNYAVYPAELISSNPAAYIKIPLNAPRKVVKRIIITSEQFNTLLKKYPFGSAMYINVYFTIAPVSYGNVPL